FLFEPPLEGVKRKAFGWLTFSKDIVFASTVHGKGVTAPLNPDDGTLIKTWKKQPEQEGGCVPAVLTPNCVLWGRMPQIAVYGKIDAAGRFPYRTFSGLRTTCFFPVVPANGMLYILGAGCRCTHRFRSNIGMISGRKVTPDKKDVLLKGPAFGGERPAKDDSLRWAGWRANSARTGITKENGTGLLKQLWVKKLPGELTPVAAWKNKVFVGSTARKLIALDAATGRQVWEYVTGGGIRITPHLENENLTIGDENGWAHCVRAADGEWVWKLRAAPAEDRITAYGDIISRWPVGSGVLVHENVAYFVAGLFPCDGSAVYAVDADTGKVRWKTLTGFTSNSRHPVSRGPMTLAKGTLYVTTKWGPPQTLLLNDPKHLISAGRTGKGEWVTVAGNDVLTSSRELKFVWHTKYASYTQSLPIIDEATIYLRGSKKRKEKMALRAEHRSAFVLKSGQLKVIKNKAKGTERLIWEAWKTAQMFLGIKAGNVLYTVGRDIDGTDRVYATDADSGKELWSAKLPAKGFDLAFTNGRLFVVCYAGNLLCFGQQK
ncbi:MAG: PQQ-binding-like beta-propeller repeat protein, partial [Kiritimatiellae bacterium]|nr:PQQ-binding-like beta-propeller repeat protein [Kiritimatiellia bacterium]